MVSWRGLRVLALAVPWWLAAPAPAGEVCDPARAGGPIHLMILKSASQVHDLAGSVARGVPVVSRDAATVVFQDGRVITADVEGASRHLNALGWSARPIDVVASFAGRRARPRRPRG